LALRALWRVVGEIVCLLAMIYPPAFTSMLYGIQCRGAIIARPAR
jgi:hypothetical protein